MSDIGKDINSVLKMYIYLILMLNLYVMQINKV
jgi:hypothetical protein